MQESKVRGSDPSAAFAAQGPESSPHEPPPFAKLRLIEAACRHRNYTRAAGECQVTRPAVSAQVHWFETRFGVTLFEKDGLSMRPTQAAWELARAYIEARHVLGRALERLPGGGAAPWPE